MLRWDPPNPIASCEFKPFWHSYLRIYGKLVCRELSKSFYMLGSSLLYCSWAIQVSRAAEHLCCVVILNPFQESYLLWRVNNLFRESRNESWKSCFAKTTVSSMRRQFTLHTICINFQVVFFADNFRECAALNEFHEEIFKLHLLLNQGWSIF